MKDFFKRLFKSILFDLGLAVVAIVALAIYLLLPGSINAESYTLLAPLPGLDTTDAISGIGPYINTLFKLAIGLGSVLAVLMIAVGGLQYMSTDQFTKKSEGRTRITYAILGLLLLLLSSVILGTINSDLLDVDIELETAYTDASLETYTVTHTKYCEKRMTGQRTSTITETCYDSLAECRDREKELFSWCVPVENSRTISINDCKECVRVTGAIKGSNACIGQAERGCYLNKDFDERANRLNELLGEYGKIHYTEVFPPVSLEHASECHYDGTCADINHPGLPPLGVANADQVSQVIEKAKEVGLCAVYEVRFTYEQSSLLQFGNDHPNLNSSNVKFVPGINAPHYSLYKAGSPNCGN